MKLSKVLGLAVFFGLVAVLSSEDVPDSKDVQIQTAEERAYVSRVKVESFLKKHDAFIGSSTGLAMASAGGIIALSSINYTQSGGQVAWEVANAVVPIIGAALAFIPVVGPLVSGIFMSIWGLISPMIQPKQENPMEKMIKELAKDLRIEMDDKLSSLVNRAIYGEIARNNYICNKYSYISHSFDKEFKANISLNIHDAIRLIVYLNDCDNFLKDTAEAFVYDEYADVLWVPSAITTSVRLGFLTEVIKYGHLMGIQRNVTASYFRELKNDIERQFKLHWTGMEKMRYEVVKKHLYLHAYNSEENYLNNISRVELSACKMQSQLLYFDSEVYPYGIPKILNKTNLLEDVRMADHYNQINDGNITHLQILFNVNAESFPGNYLPSENKFWHRILEFMNCYMGPTFQSIPSVFWFKFYPVSGEAHSYEFRVMYFHTAEINVKPGFPVPILTKFNSSSDEFKAYQRNHLMLGLSGYPNANTAINITFVLPTDPRANESKKINDMPIMARWKTCPYHLGTEPEMSPCHNGVKFYSGMFRIYSAGIFNVGEYENMSPLIVIDNPMHPFQVEHKNRVLEVGFLVGVEIIMREYMK